MGSNTVLNVAADVVDRGFSVGSLTARCCASLDMCRGTCYGMTPCLAHSKQQIVMKLRRPTEVSHYVVLVVFARGAPPLSATKCTLAFFGFEL